MTFSGGLDILGFASHSSRRGSNDDGSELVKDRRGQAYIDKGDDDDDGAKRLEAEESTSESERPCEKPECDRGDEGQRRHWSANRGIKEYLGL